MKIIFNIEDDATEALIKRWMFEKRRSGHLVTNAAIRRELIPMMKRMADQGDRHAEA